MQKGLSSSTHCDCDLEAEYDKVFSVLPLCSLCLCGDCLDRYEPQRHREHRGSTEITQERSMTQNTDIKVIDVDKIGSATSPLGLAKTVAVVSSCRSPRAGDVVVVRAL